MNGASGFQVWRDIKLTLMLPALCSAAMLIFMDTVGDYGLSSTITAVYSYPTLPYTIYSAICTSPARFDMADVYKRQTTRTVPACAARRTTSRRPVP